MKKEKGKKVSFKENWKDINSDFNEELRESWEFNAFSYQEAQDWIEKAGLNEEEFNFAAFLRSEGYEPEGIDEDQLTELREIYDNWEEGIQETEEGDDRDWRNIHQHFTHALIKTWQNLNFTYEETRDWISTGLGVNDAGFCAWLRDEKKVDSDWLLNNGDLEELRQQYRQYQELVAQQLSTHLY